MVFSTEKFGGDDTARNETLFTTGNGNLGFRGDTEEKAGTVHKGTYINGFYDSEPIQYGESAYGYAKNHETILNLPDPKCIELRVNGAHFGTAGGDDSTVTAFKLELDEASGVMRRFTEWKAPACAAHIRVESTRLVSFAQPDCAVIRYTVTNLSEECADVAFLSAVDLTAGNVLAEEDPRIGAKFRHKPLVIDAAGGSAAKGEGAGAPYADGLFTFDAHTANSGLLLSGAVRNELMMRKTCGSTTRLLWHSTAEEAGFGAWCSPDARGMQSPACCALFTLACGESAVLTKYIAYSHAPMTALAAEALHEKALSACEAFAAAGFDAALNAQKAFLADFWRVASICIEEEKTVPGASSAEDALRFNLFHLLQSAGRSGMVSIAAKGLTSEGYEGHYFWDTESYVCPVFTYTAPAVAKKLLAYRASILDKARSRARVMSLKGALYPWRTISGEETSAYFPAGTAQYHINADILFACNRFINAHGADERDGGFDEKTFCTMLAESARMYYSLGFFNEHKGGAFCINDVTGPDEYTAIVNNNAFTNLMVRETFELASRLCGSEATAEEKAAWTRAASAMYIPFDSAEAVYPQDDSFMDKPDWDFEHTPRAQYPLLLHFHPLVIYRHRVLKQPDLVLALFLLSGRFTLAEKIRNFHFYERYTTGDSSLSHCIMSIMAQEVGESEKALGYFNQTVRMDIDDVNGNSRDGIHTACMAGSWMSVVYGFAGFRDYAGRYCFNPRLPDGWKRLSFSLAIQGFILAVEVTKTEASYSLRLADEDAGLKASRTLTLTHRNVDFTLASGESRTFSLRPKLGAVLFDLDGVITNTAHLHYKAWKEMADAEHLRFDEHINKQLLGISREASLDVILRENGVCWPQEKKDAWCARKNERYKELLQGLSEKDILPGIRELLENLQSHGIPAVLASSSKNAPRILRALGLENYFSALAAVERVQKAKPEPDLFLDAAEKAGVWYADCVGIEDAQSGIQAIKRAGMKAVGIESSISLPKADLQLASTADLSYKKLVAIMEGKNEGEML